LSIAERGGFFKEGIKNEEITTEDTEFLRERKKRRYGGSWCESSALYFLLLFNSEFNSVYSVVNFLGV